jgi:HipA-like protein
VADIEVATDGALSLRYTERWRLAEGAFPLSVTMPLRAAPYPSEVIAPWLANLLPEEEQLRILTRSLGIDQADVLALLEQIGGDTAGALSFGVPTDRARWAWRPLNDLYGLDDPAEALAAYPDAAAHFTAFPQSVRRGILEWIKRARRPDTRARRITETARLAAQNRRANPFR